MSTIVAEQNWIERLRKKGMDDFLSLGFPTTKLEDWKYTNVAPIRRTTFINGSFAPRFSTPDARLNIHLLPLSEALQDPERSSVIKDHLGRHVDTSRHAFAAWNTAVFSDGVYLEIPRGVICEQPIHLDFVAAGSNAPWACHPRNLIVAGQDSQITLVESFIGSDDDVYLTNTVTEIAVGPGAVIDYYKIERESPRAFHVAVINAHLARDANLTSHSMSFGGSLVRNDLNVVLGGEGSHCTLNGLFVVDGQRLVDNHTRIDHVRPHASSRELYKGVLAGSGEGVFNGAIAVHENAQKTDAVQHSKNLLLSREAQINTKPQLEIRNNDVRCFHGAAIGQIDTEAVFYLKSRGIAEWDAKRILVSGFAGEVIDSIRVSAVRDQLEHLMEGWFQSVLEA